MSAKKRTSLDAVFATTRTVTSHAEGKGARAKKAAQTETDVKEGLSQDQQTAASEPAPKRPHVRQHTAYLPIGVHEQLRKLAFEEDRKIHDYLLEGLDRVFADRGLPAVKDLKQ